MESSDAIHVVVQSCPQRRTSRQVTLRSIEQSDIGTRYTLLEQPEPALPVSPPLIMAHLRTVIQALYDSGAPYGLRLEDDCIVNRHILHNLLTRPALSEANFGIGWLFCSQPLLNDRKRLRYSNATQTPYRDCPAMFLALGVLFPRAHIPPILERLRGIEQDIGVSRAVWELGKRCYFHVPALVENRPELPSAKGNVTDPRFHLARRLFDPEWKR